MVVVTVAELSVPPSGSCAALLATTVFVTTPELARTVTTTVKLPVAPLANDGFVQVMVPLAPTAGVAQLQPAGALIDWKPTEGSRVCVKVAFGAASGPAF